jgi:hypothetical protein
MTIHSFVGGANQAAVFRPDTDVLESIADWRDHLIKRIAWARLRYELVGDCREEIISLSAEAEACKQTCAALRGEWGLA